MTSKVQAIRNKGVRAEGRDGPHPLPQPEPYSEELLKPSGSGLGRARSQYLELVEKWPTYRSIVPITPRR